MVCNETRFEVSAPPGPAARTGRALARAQGLYLLVTGVWPLLHYRSFEAVLGPKVDDWLVRCVSGLAVTLAYQQLRTRATSQGLTTARRIGIGAALSFGGVDLRYGGSGRISRIYLLDAAVQACWLAAWIKTASPSRAHQAER